MAFSHTVPPGVLSLRCQSDRSALVSCQATRGSNVPKSLPGSGYKCPIQDSAILVSNSVVDFKLMGRRAAKPNDSLYFHGIAFRYQPGFRISADVLEFG